MKTKIMSPGMDMKQEKVSELGKAIIYNMREEHVDKISNTMKENKPLRIQKEFKELIGKVNDVVVEHVEKGISFEEALGKSELKEDLTISNTGSLFTTAVASFIEQRLRPNLVAADLIKFIPNFSLSGSDSVKIPIRSALITAADLPPSAEVTYDTGTYSDTTIQIEYKYAANSITIPSMQQANVDIMANELFEIGDALRRKSDSDIIAEFESATPSDGSNSNYTALGTSTVVDYDNFVDALVAMMANDSDPTDILTNPASYGNILKSATLITSLGRANGGSGTGNTFPRATELLNMTIHASSQVSSDDVFLIEAGKTGYFMEGTSVQAYDGRRSKHLAMEVIGAYPYGVAIVQPATIYRIRENTAA